MCKCMFRRHIRSPLGEAAWTVKCCFSGTKVADSGCAILYFICWLVHFFHIDFVKGKILFNFEYL